MYPQMVFGRLHMLIASVWSAASFLFPCEIKYPKYTTSSVQFVLCEDYTLPLCGQMLQEYPKVLHVSLLVRR